MQLLLSFVNSELSLGGFDWDTGKLFWSLASNRLRACGICYDGLDLLVGSDDRLHRLSRDGESVSSLPGPHPALLHSVHRLADGRIGAVDTGNSAVRIYDKAGGLNESLCPVAGWPHLPPDAIHLNDFAETPHGLIASCFNFRPWRDVREKLRDLGQWTTLGLGLLFNVTAAGGHGRLVGCGLDHPHSVVWQEPYLYHCSSSTGSLHVWEFFENGTLVERDRIDVTAEHFLRGALLADGAWYLGGSTARHGPPPGDRMAVYRLNDAPRRVERRFIEAVGEIYEILPWRDDVMQPLIDGHFRRT